MTDTPRFQPGDLVIYGGSIWQRHGLMYVSTVEATNGGWRYSLTDPIWGGALRSVREASLRDAALTHS
ncbi:hypothetical protein [Streptomyces capoamus]|uniref:hypothetical protein n=1 Tax=Streptomyces capoamus TaxID=68183 RepID=UPI00339749AE